MALHHLGRRAVLALVTGALFVAASTTAMAADDDQNEQADQSEETMLAQQPEDDPLFPDDPEQQDDPDDPAAPEDPAQPDEPDDPFMEPQEDPQQDPEAVLAEREELEDMFFARLTPGVWAPWLAGDMTIDDRGVEVDQNIGETFEQFGLGWTGSLQLGFGEFGLLSDVFYLTSTDDDATVDPQFDEAEVDTRVFGTNASVAWFANLDEFGEVGPHIGIRYMWVDTELDTVADDEEETFDATEGWVDPIVGVAGRLNPVPDGILYFPFYADVGGIVAGSDLSWQAKAAVGIELHDYLGVELGYRHLHIDYEGDDLDYDTMITGPTLGITGQFD